MPAKACFAEPKTLLKASVCLLALSKDLEGSLRPVLQRPHRCVAPGCATFKTVHQLALAVKPHACDVVKRLNGRILVRDLVTIFSGDAHGRGVHAGTFEWEGTSVRATGSLSGVTNVGTHRSPVFKACQRCKDIGVLEGRLCGEVVKASDPTWRGARITAAYRLRFDPTERGGEGAVEATLEGVLALTCR